MKEIPLTQGRVALVDDDDYELVSRYKWHTWVVGKSVYAQAHEPMVDRKQKSVMLHRLLLRPAKGMEVDHKNGDGLDCRRSNLRICTREQNQRNTGIPKSNTSGYKGVSWCSRKRKWQASIKFQGRSRNLGYFVDITAAARAYDTKAKELFGEFARPNFAEVADWRKERP